MDQTRSAEDPISDSPAVLIHEEICNKTHPSRLMGEDSLPPYQHLCSQISSRALSGWEEGVWIVQRWRDICWRPADSQVGSIRIVHFPSAGNGGADTTPDLKGRGPPPPGK